MTADFEESAHAQARNAASGPSPEASEPRSGAAREDFLFHLYRGSELLNDNRPLEARSELEHALTLEPHDRRAQALLAVVYFRIGQHARASDLFEALVVEQPDDLGLRVNLALSQLKSGRPEPAHLQLRQVVELEPGHIRAWGYLGVALERLGRRDEAHTAFARAGQHEMARRMIERDDDARAQDLDAGELNLALTSSPAAPPGHAAPPPRRLDTLTWGISSGSTVSAHVGWAPPPTLAGLIADATPPRADSARCVAVLAHRLARIEIDGSQSGFALRLDALRSYAGVLDPDILSQQSRAPRDSETFGGVGTPFVSMRGPGHAVLGARPSQRVAAFDLQGGVVFFRRDALVGFELTLSYENGRLSLGDGDAAPLVQLQGDGAVLLELPCELIAQEVHGGAGVTLRKETLVGWTGRLLPRILPPGEAPCGQRGLIAFSGEGTLLMAGK